MILQYRNISAWGATSYFILSDIKDTTARPVFYWIPIDATNQMVIDFTDCPRLFEGDSFGIYSPYGMGLGEFIVFNLYGWEEQQ